MIIQGGTQASFASMQISSQRTERSLVRKQLPPELILYIFDLLEDRSNLHCSNDEELIPSTASQFSLVCHAWNDICRPRIFRSVIIHDLEMLIHRLSFLHSSAPHLCKYIFDLRLLLNSMDLLVVEPVPPWIPDCFNRFKNLHTLYLGKEGVMVPGITSLLAAPRLRKLHLEGRVFASDDSYLLSLLPSTNPQLEELALVNIDIPADFVDEHSLKVPPIVRFEALRRLELNDVAYALLKCRVFIECPNLTSLVGQWRLPGIGVYLHGFQPVCQNL